MATHIISRRIQSIIQYVFDVKYPSKRDILDFLEEKDFRISTRTLERDFERIRADFGLEISYRKTDSGYYIDEEKSVRVDSFFKFLEIVSLADIFSESLLDSNKILNYVSFDDSKYFKGVENLKDILIAINQNRKIQFVHENFHQHTHKEYQITPLLLKEYENRWYVVGVPDGMNEIRTFGVDRLSKLILGKLSKLKKKAFSNQIKNFENIVGINFEGGKPEKISIMVEALHIKYMKSLPLHHSQIIHLKNTDNHYQVDFYLIPNYEFMTQILKMGDAVVIIKPYELKNSIKKILQSLLKKYN